MDLVVVFALALLVGVLLSDLASRSILSTAIFFLAAGVVARLVGAVELEPSSSGVRELIELALFAVLFTDALKVGVSDLARAWRLPGRALLFGMPATMVLTALLARSLAGLGWTESFLLGAVLAPTDPVLASAIIGRPTVPARLRHLLNVESGLNDGLALPFVLVLISVAAGTEADALTIATELLLGVALGVVVPAIAIVIARARLLTASVAYEPLHGFAIGLAVYALGRATHANLFLAAFAAGVTVATLSPAIRHRFDDFGSAVAELLKLASLLLLGLFIVPDELGAVGIGGFVFAALVLFAVRPVAVGASLLGGGLSRGEFWAAGWFGPKGFASVVYGLLILASGMDGAPRLFSLTVLVIIGSIVVHSTTDHVVAERFRRSAERAEVEASG